MAKSIIELPRGVPDNARGWLEIFGRINKFLRVSGDELVIGGDVQLPAQSVGTTELEDVSVTDEKLRESQATSVIGRSVNSAGAPSDIQASTNGHYFRRAGDVLGFGAIADADLPATIARDSEITSAISNHEAASDPHPGYTTAAELATSISNHEAAVDPHPTYTTATEVATAITSAINALSLASGTYTPTLTGVANITGTTAYACQYLRVGSVVTVSGRIDVDPTAAVATQVGISLPIASNFTTANAEDCGGVAYCQVVAGFGAAIYADITNDRAQMEWVAVDTAARSLWFTFTYRII